MTTQVLLWGHCRQSEEAGNTPRTPALVEHDGLRGIGVRSVTAGAGFSCVVTWTGELVVWGRNSKGQCGFPASVAFIDRPEKLPLPATSPCALQASCGAEHAGVVTTCGAILCWGSNGMQQLGRSDGGAMDSTALRRPTLDETQSHSP